MVAERREPQDAQGDDRDHAGIDKHAEHQPLVHHGENLPPLADRVGAARAVARRERATVRSSGGMPGP